MFRRLIPLIGLLLVSGACGDGATDTTSTTDAVPPLTTTTTPSSTTSAPVGTTTIATTTIPADTTTTTAVPSGGPYVLADPSLFPAQPLPGSNGASGSGCVPGSNTVIPDGIWFGFLLATDGSSIEFDMACFFFGDIAYTEGAADGVEVNNDYYIRNQNPLTFDVPMATAAKMYWLDSSSGNFEPTPMSMADWPGPDEDWPCPGEFCGVWLYINEGEITEAVEQYLP